MKKVVLAAVCLMALHIDQATAQTGKQCGTHELELQLAADNPDFYQKRAEYFAEQEALAEMDKLAGTVSKSTAQYPIPVIFHVMLNSAQINNLGGTAGINARCVAQINQLNKDFNRQNADSTFIPTGLKAFYGNANLQFSLAHTDPDGDATPGYEVLSTTANSFPMNGGQGSGYMYSSAKYHNGSPSQWDPSKYLNVWVVNFSDPNLLGIAAPPYMAYNGGQLPLNERGVTISFGTLGHKPATGPYLYYSSPYELGRTLTHELGHYFELRHIWGDDGGLCPTQSGGQDDGITDTPPQADASSGSMNGVQYDGCTSGGNGIMYMNFMDYSNDNRSLMFTIKQAQHMHVYVDGTNSESHSLTQHPELTQWPTEVSSIEPSNHFDIFPNPSNGRFSLNFAGVPQSLQQVLVTNMMGQTVFEQSAEANTGIYTIDISGMSKGIYFVQCHFAEGVVTRKIVVE